MKTNIKKDIKKDIKRFFLNHQDTDYEYEYVFDKTRKDLKKYWIFDKN